jgi:hypothetical protein
VTAAPKDRWHQLADAIKASNLPPSDRSVFRLLLDKADFGTAVIPAGFSPTRKRIRRETGLSYSQVGYSTHHLERHGWLSAKGATGPGHPLRYSLALGRDCDCTGRVHARKRCQPGEATLPTDDPRTLPTNGANAAGQMVVSTERHREGGVGRKPESKAQTQIQPESGPQPVRVVGDGSGPDDRDSFGGWLALISGRAEPSRGTPPGRQP